MFAYQTGCYFVVLTNVKPFYLPAQSTGCDFRQDCPSVHCPQQASQRLQLPVDCHPPRHDPGREVRNDVMMTSSWRHRLAHPKHEAVERYGWHAGFLLGGDDVQLTIDS
jgi:hypothetical protein